MTRIKSRHRATPTLCDLLSRGCGYGALRHRDDLRIPLGAHHRRRHIRLAGELTLPKRARGIVLFAHGSGSPRSSPRNTYVATMLRGADIAILLFDLLEEWRVGFRTIARRIPTNAGAVPMPGASSRQVRLVSPGRISPRRTHTPPCSQCRSSPPLRTYWPVG